MQSSAPVIFLIIFVKWEYLEPRSPFSKSYSRLEYPIDTFLIFSNISSFNTDLPRFVWITTPEALITFLKFNIFLLYTFFSILLTKFLII